MMPSCSVQLQQLQVKTRWPAPKSHAGIMHQCTDVKGFAFWKLLGAIHLSFLYRTFRIRHKEPGMSKRPLPAGQIILPPASCWRLVTNSQVKLRVCLYALATSCNLSFSKCLLQNLSFACHSASWPIPGFPTQSLPEIPEKIREIGENLGWQSQYCRSHPNQKARWFHCLLWDCLMYAWFISRTHHFHVVSMCCAPFRRESKLGKKKKARETPWKRVLTMPGLFTPELGKLPPLFWWMPTRTEKRKGGLKKKIKTECKYQSGVLSPGWVSALSAGVFQPLSHGWIPCLTLCTCLTVAQRTGSRPSSIHDQKHTALYVQLTLMFILHYSIHSTYMILHTSMTNLRHSKSESGLDMAYKRLQFFLCSQDSVGKGGLCQAARKHCFRLLVSFLLARNRLPEQKLCISIFLVQLKNLLTITDALPKVLQADLRLRKHFQYTCIHCRPFKISRNADFHTKPRIAEAPQTWKILEI